MTAVGVVFFEVLCVVAETRGLEGLLSRVGLWYVKFLSFQQEILLSRLCLQQDPPGTRLDHWRTSEKVKLPLSMRLAK